MASLMIFKIFVLSVCIWSCSMGLTLCYVWTGKLCTVCARSQLQTPVINKFARKSNWREYTEESPEKPSLEARVNISKHASSRSFRKHHVHIHSNTTQVCYCYTSKEVVRSTRKHVKHVMGTQAKTKLWSGLNSNDSYNLEVVILKRLNAVVSPCIRHWPKLLDYNDKKLSITTTWDGYTLDSVGAQPKFCALGVSDVIDQGRCIEMHLKKSNVTHNDHHAHTNGKNLMIHNGHITLYDFNIATIDGLPRLPTTYQYNKPDSVLEELLRLRLDPLSICGQKHSQQLDS